MAIAEKSEAVNPIYVNIYIWYLNREMITIMMMMMTMTPVFLGYPIPKRDMLQSRLVHGQRLGTGEVGTG